MVLPHFLEVHPPNSSLLSYFCKHYSNTESSSCMGDTKMIKDDEKWKGWQRNLASSHTPGKASFCGGVMRHSGNAENLSTCCWQDKGQGLCLCWTKDKHGAKWKYPFPAIFPLWAHRATQWHPRVSQVFFFPKSYSLHCGHFHFWASRCTGTQESPSSATRHVLPPFTLRPLHDL